MKNQTQEAFVLAVNAIERFIRTLPGAEHGGYEFHIEERVVYRALLACRFPEADIHTLSLAAARIADFDEDAAEMWDLLAKEVAAKEAVNS